MNCKNCKNYTPLEEPRVLDDYLIVYEYCYKKKPGLVNTGYPVYLPNGKCKEHVHVGGKQELEGQMEITDYPEVMP